MIFPTPSSRFAKKIHQNEENQLTRYNNLITHIADNNKYTIPFTAVSEKRSLKMVSKTKLDPTTNPIELLDSTLEQSWKVLCAAYEVEIALPNTQNLFTKAAIKTPPKAAETVLVNMLAEVIENVGRFSPWYKQPARAFGLVSLRDPVTGQSHWLLAPEALQRWRGLLQGLTQAIKLNNGLIQATLLVENLAEELDDPQVIAKCECYPPKRIQINLSILDKTTIICDECQQAFE